MINLLFQESLLALGVAASPLPIVAVVVVLLTKRARLSSLLMLVSWVSGVSLMLILSMAFADYMHEPRAGLDFPAEGLVSLLLGVGLLVMGIVSRRGRFRSENPAQPPAWVAGIDNMSPAGGVLLVFLNATTSPKNLALAIAAGRLLTKPPEPLALAAPLSVFYICVASLALTVPVGLYWFGGSRSETALRNLKDRVTAKSAAVSEITLLVLGLALSAKGLMNLLG